MEKKCEWCGKILENPHPQQRFCTDKSTCRVAAWRARRVGNIYNAVSDDCDVKYFKQR